MRKLSILFLLSILSTLTWAQKNEKLKESYVDSASYVYFFNGKHQELVVLTKIALSAGIDSYLLRVRIGVSYFNKNDFYRASIHLRKALEYYPSDMYTKEYLFYSYLYMENFEEAKLIITKMPIAYHEGYKKLIKFQNSFVFESGYQFTSYQNNQDSSVFLANDLADTSLHGNGVYAESDRMKSIQYVQIGIGYPISKRIKGYSGLSLVRNNREEHIYSKQYVWDHTNSVYLPIIKDTSHSYTLSQYQVYSGLTITLPKRFNLLVGGQYMYYSQNKLYANYNSTTFNYSYHDSVTSRNNFVTNVSISKAYSKLIPMISLGFNKVDEISIMQYASQITYLPLGNFNLNITAGVSLSKDVNETRNVYFAKIGGKLTDKLWYDAYLYSGNLKNFTEGNGYVVYNISDKITMKSGFNLTYYINQKWNLGLRYDLLKRESNYDRYYTSNSVSKSKSYTDNYLNHSLIFNLLWKF
jgi:hypothetical protein